jgi:RNA polymerase sigma-70 factor, ECF subfamily
MVARLTDPVDEAIERALLAWPGLADVELKFEVHVAERGVEPAALEQHGPDLYLAFACAHHHRGALVILDREFLVQMRTVIGRVHGAAEFVDEGVQLLRESLLKGPQPKIGSYDATLSLKEWIRLETVPLALSLQESTKRRDAELVMALRNVCLPAASPADAPAEAVERGLRAGVAELISRRRNVLRLHYLDGLDIDQIGVLYGAPRAAIARWLGPKTDDLLELFSAQLAQAVDPSALEQLRPRLRTSFSALLDAMPGPR